jgi:hypothetical protein
MNRITIELCAEDRARLDRLTAALEKAADTYAPVMLETPEQLRIPDELLQPKPIEEPKNEPQESIEAETPATTPTEEEKPEEVKDAAPEEAKTEPAVNLAQIQQKVVQLCAGYEGKKKPAVRAIINTYGSKVSDLKEQPDKWNEVWDKLTALEKE